MKILVIGSGGREHAICRALKQSPSVTKLFCAPGNGGIAQDAECVQLHGYPMIIQCCQKENIDLVVIGPEQPLVEGLADLLREADINVFGPSAKAAQLEGSKDFTKQLCDRMNIPTAAYATFDNKADALAYLEQQGAPIVIKADGLAAGKGVTVAMNLEQAKQAVEECFDGRFGEAGSKVVIEEFLEGEEVSVFALCDGERAVEFASAQDHKAVGEGDTGPNTGGMGTFSPAPIMSDALRSTVMEQIIQPAVTGMKEMGMPYQGVLFAGLMITKHGPKLIEFNCRFGDPETQVMLPRLESDLAQILHATATGELDKVQVKLRNEAALCVVMAANGYPGAYEKGTRIRGIDAAEALDGVTVFHAGTKEENGEIYATGGRVLGVTALAPTIAAAQEQAYKAVDRIVWPEGFCRRDIGWRAVQKQAG